jgi:hypothetical protein
MASFAVEEFWDDLLAFIEGTAGAGCRRRDYGLYEDDLPDVEGRVDDVFDSCR